MIQFTEPNSANPSSTELQQKVQGRSEGQTVIKELVGRLKKLRTLYLFHCPSDKIVVRSESLERLHVYRSEFAAFEELRAPRLRSMMFQNHARELHDELELSVLVEANGEPKHATYQDEAERPRPLLELIFEGCPKLEQLNNVSLVEMRSRDVGRSAWCRQTRQMCLEKYRQSISLMTLFEN